MCRIRVVRGQASVVEKEVLESSRGFVVVIILGYVLDYGIVSFDYTLIIQTHY